MKILNLISTLGAGGAERQLSIIAPALACAGVEVHVGYCRGGPNLVPLEHSNVALHLLPSSGTHDPILLWRIVQLVRHLQPDIIQTWLLQMDILGGIAGRLGHIPVIVSERSSSTNYSPGWKTSLRLMIGRMASCVVANSKGGMDYWRPYLSQEKLHLIRNCIIQTKEPSSEENNLSCLVKEGQPLVIFAGRFSHEKNIPNLIKALVLVARENPDVLIMLFGEGPEEGYVRQKILNEDLSDRIVLAGYSSRLAKWMSRASVCVSVSHFEGHPNVVMEAAIAGCPLLLSDITAHREIFNENSALFAPPHSPRLIADALLESLRRPDDALRRANCAKEIATQFDLASTVNAYIALYENLIKNPK